ncbi:MAG TPA: TraB/GumN family protein, partial [Ramlibacter sp.]|nr:TraB/GumN family protein [Ramlibacter sp.]
MPLLRFLLIPFLLLAASAAAQPAPGCPPPPLDLQKLPVDELRAGARDRGVLWRLEKDGRTSWLYGTVHVSRVDWVVPGAFIQHALEASDVLALELDPADPELGRRLFAAGGDAGRQQRVLEGLQPRIAALAQRACLRPEGLAALRP